MSDPFHLLGIVAAILIAGALALLLVNLFCRAWYSDYGPRLHFGKPELRGELAFYSRSHIITKKGGEKMTPEEIDALPDRKNHAFDVPWFAGLSTRKGHFLLGIIRLKRQAP